ncbi:hypothetical protein C8R47DRAFT_1046793 [Mycena vitilis]|nr:hypothetical protein C8R47DRAFT_1324989 [Mycena vitilis]KAJ6488641.1 hypothetical protein C8R47DRAFT_1046793 [Mycena vitilis]
MFKGTTFTRLANVWANQYRRRRRAVEAGACVFLPTFTAFFLTVSQVSRGSYFPVRTSRSLAILSLIRPYPTQLVTCPPACPAQSPTSRLTATSPRSLTAMVATTCDSAPPRYSYNRSSLRNRPPRRTRRAT